MLLLGCFPVQRAKTNNNLTFRCNARCSMSGWPRLKRITTRLLRGERTSRNDSDERRMSISERELCLWYYFCQRGCKAVIVNRMQGTLMKQLWNAFASDVEKNIEKISEFSWFLYKILIIVWNALFPDTSRSCSSACSATNSTTLPLIIWTNGESNRDQRSNYILQFFDNLKYSQTNWALNTLTLKIQIMHSWPKVQPHHSASWNSPNGSKTTERRCIWERRRTLETRWKCRS